jgi:predicted glycoside hydrolase/deacetylase ChbG (UPF0249 family)
MFQPLQQQQRRTSETAVNGSAQTGAASGAAQATARRTLMMCADDFGLDPGISIAIVRLARAGRLNAVSSLCTTSGWGHDAEWLDELPDSVHLGLHFNLTLGRPLSRRLARIWPSFPPLPRLIALAHLGLLPRAALRAEFHAQFGAYVKATERPPHFIDSRQQVHHLPTIRSIILDAVEHIQPMPALISTAPVRGAGFDLKRRFIERSGALELAAELRRRVIPHNPALLGVYDFRQTDYRRLMRGWLATLPQEGALLCCHPGGVSSVRERDDVGPARIRELDYLASDAFTQDLEQAGVTLGSVWR